MASSSYLSDYLPVAHLVGNLIVAERIKHFAAFCGNRRFVSTFRDSSVASVESQLNPFYIHSVDIHVNIILPSTQWSPIWSASFRNSLSFIYVASQLNTVHIHPVDTHFNIILPSTLWSPNRSASFIFSHQKTVVSPLFHACYMPPPATDSLTGSEISDLH